MRAPSPGVYAGRHLSYDDRAPPVSKSQTSSMARPRPDLASSVDTLPKPRPSTHSEPVERSTGGRRPYNPAAEVPGAKYRTIGSLIGRLGQIDVDNRREFRLFDRHTDWATPVTHGPEHLGALTAALGTTVIVSGQLWRGANRKPLRLEFRKLRVIDFDSRRSLDDLIGIAPDFTGGLSSEEYVRRLRDDD